jgi:HPt (histidine-containing phosphotransfer) domain-containing protein
MISVERIDELRSEVGEEDFAEIAALFLSEADLLVSDLAEVPDMATAEPLLHSLKGSALNLGFVHLADLCREGQAAGLSADAWAARLDHIRAVYEESKARLAALG